MVDIAALNSRVRFDKTDIPFDQRNILGDATETGLTRFAGRYLGTMYDDHLAKYSKVFEGASSLLEVTDSADDIPKFLSIRQTNGLWSSCVLTIPFTYQLTSFFSSTNPTPPANSLPTSRELQNVSSPNVPHISKMVKRTL